jgi:4a-hydroxytetrahydrobiopterin dehydratase
MTGGPHPTIPPEPTAMTDAAKPAEKVYTEAEIAEKLKELPGWELKDGWIRRKYKTGGWQHSLMLTNTLAYLADAAWHHPDIRTSYLEVTAMLKTHSAGGITDKDFALARKFDEVALWQPAEGGPLEGYERGLKGKKNWTK